MAFGLDVEAAINSIATLEAAIVTPSPGITNAYTFGNNPVQFTAGSALPAVVHVSRGPVATNIEAFNSFEAAFDIDSIMLIMEALPDGYPGDEAESIVFWPAICDTFLNLTNQSTIIAAAGATGYDMLFNDLPSFDVRPWPPLPGTAIKWFWSFQYTHRFTTENKNT